MTPHTKPAPAPVPAYRPKLQPVAPGEFTVGVVTITTRHATPTDALTEELLGYYKNRGQDNKRKRIK